jgi:hypothetical protein
MPLPAFFTKTSMNRSHPAKKINKSLPVRDLRKKTAVHEAGHAAAVYLGNQQKQLPLIYFQIVLNPPPGHKAGRKVLDPFGNRNHAEIKGGRLIHTLPLSVEEMLGNFPEFERETYMQAFDADIVNTLVGPLAEAKYVALSLEETVTPPLANFDSLHHYGGASDLKTVHDYLDCWSDDPARKARKMVDLFLAAYAFINDEENWEAILRLADFMIESGKAVIACEEAMAVLDANRFVPSASHTG